jgi:hypothetical protein
MPIIRTTNPNPTPPAPRTEHPRVGIIGGDIRVAMPEGTDEATQRWADDHHNAGVIADQILGDSAAARIEDPHAEENAEYLKMLKSRLGGLDAEEMRAARDQGQLELGRQTAQNLERYGSIAGASGVQGGARAALMGKALNESNFARGSLERQLIMDNIAAKDRAHQAYGGALQGATATGLDIQRYNAGAQDRDTAARIGLPFDVMSGIGSYRAEDQAQANNQAAIDLAKEAVNKQSQPVTAPQNTPNQLDEDTTYKVEKITTALNEIGGEVGKNIGPFYLPTTEISKAVAAIKERVALQFPDEPETELKNKTRAQLIEWLWNAGVINKEGQTRTGGPMAQAFLGQLFGSI